MKIPPAMLEMLWGKMIERRGEEHNKLCYQKCAAADLATELGVPLAVLEKEAYNLARRRKKELEGLFVCIISIPVFFLYRF